MIDLEAVKELLKTNLDYTWMIWKDHERIGETTTHQVIFALVSELEEARKEAERLREENKRLDEGRHHYKQEYMKAQEKLNSQWTEKKCHEMAEAIDRLSEERAKAVECLKHYSELEKLRKEIIFKDLKNNHFKTATEVMLRCDLQMPATACLKELGVKDE